MFEKEAEEYYYKTYPVTLNIGEEERKEEVTDIFIKGAEYGYNKVNEWHYVKDGDLPKDDIKLAIIEIDDCGYLLCNYRNGFWYDANSGATCAEWITNNIIAWKEIVLPKED
jgi:hypothetical protein